MSTTYRVIRVFNGVATGTRRALTLLTPIGVTVFGVFTTAFEAFRTFIL